MARGRREKIDERVARMVRDDRARVIGNSQSGGIIKASMAYEGWYDGDPPETHPQPDTDHQPAFDEPTMNSFDGSVWSVDDPYWLRVPIDGLWRASFDAQPNVTVILGGTGSGYIGIRLRTYVEFARGHDLGDPDIPLYPVGRDDPFGPPGIWSASAGFCYDERILPEGEEDFAPSFSTSGPPFEMTEDDSVRVIFHATTLEDFGVDDYWFNLAFQGDLCLELVSE